MKNRIYQGLALAVSATLICTNSSEAQPSGPYEKDDNTLLLLHFDEGSGTPKDAVNPKAYFDTHNFDWSEEGKFGKGVKISGGDGDKPSYIRVDSDNIDLSGKQALTIEAWVKHLARGPGHQHIVSQGNMQGFQLGVSTGGSFWLNVRTEEEKWSGTFPGKAPTRIPLEEWVHIAATYDGESIKIYINGEERESKEVPGGALSAVGKFAMIGERSDLPPHKRSEGFQGLIDEVRISDVVRSFTPAPSE